VRLQNRIVVTTVAAALVLLLASALALVLVDRASGRSVETTRRAEAIQDHAHRIASLTLGAKAGQRGYALTGRTEYLDRYEQGVQDIPRRVAALAELVTTGSSRREDDQLAVVRRLRSASDDELEELAFIHRLLQQGGLELAAERLTTGRERRLGQEVIDAAEALVASARLDETDAVTARVDARDRARVVLGIAMSLQLALLAFLLLAVRERAATLVATERLAQQRDVLIDELQVLATHDPLTGLPNRRVLEERLEHALARTARRKTPLAVIFLDVNEFKSVNDSLGHAAGDELLREVGTRICRSLREVDTVARVGGDEIVVLLDEVADVGAALEVAQRIATALDGSYDVTPSARAHVSASLGVVVADSTGICLTEDAAAAAEAAAAADPAYALTEGPAVTPATLLSAADTALAETGS
jgi:diguanylate cyclase (GGDEF)-like protein